MSGNLFAKDSKERDFERLFLQYYSPFCYFAKRSVSDNIACENIVSDVFVKLWEKKEELDFNSNTIVGYIKTAVQNSCNDHLKRQKVESKYLENNIYSLPINKESPHTIYTLEELYEMFHDALNKLPKDYRKAFLMDIVEGKSQTEIAAALNVSVKTVYRYKQKTLELLKTELKDYLPLVLFFIVDV